MNLNSVLAAVAYKKLAQVDLPDGGSNQHEIDGVTALREFFDTSERVEGNIAWHYFADDKETLQDNGQYTFYDAREKSYARTGRSEWRMYYTGIFLNYAEPDDVLILLRTNTNDIHGLIFQANSALLRAAESLFEIKEAQQRLQVLTSGDLKLEELEFARQQILEELGIAFEAPFIPGDEDVAQQELLDARQEGRDFPATKRMAALAHSLVEVDIMNGDETLLAWLEREERLFRMIEHVIVEERISQGFESVDDFMSYSLSVQNRRKSRMGYALQNHLAELFTRRNITYASQARTEGKNTPDFLFPGEKEYHDPAYDERLLTMLGAKSTLKERWRQILSEAERIPNKHLCTLDQALSVDQINEMQTQRVTVVLPERFHEPYTDKQRAQIWTVEEFIGFVQEKQKGQN